MDSSITDLAIPIEDMVYNQRQVFSRRLLDHLLKLSKLSKVDIETHKKHVMGMTLLGLLQRNNLRMMKESGNSNMKAAIEKWITIYSLTDGKPTSSLTVNLVRVSACLAMVISKKLHTGVRVVNTVSADDIGTGFPKSMAFSNFGFLIPNSLNALALANMKKAFYYYQYRFSVIYSVSNKYASKDDLIKYSDIQIFSWLFTEEERMNHCQAMGLIAFISNEWVLAPAVKAGIEFAANEWDKLPYFLFRNRSKRT